MASRTVLRYIELKTGKSDRGPAWIALVRTSKTGSKIYFNGKALMRAEGSLHMDVQTRETYWVSGVKKDGSDHHWAGGGKVWIEKGAVAAYLKATGARALNKRRLVLIDDLPPPDITLLHKEANRPLTKEAYEAAVAALDLPCGLI